MCFYLPHRVRHHPGSRLFGSPQGTPSCRCRGFHAPTVAIVVGNRWVSIPRRTHHRWRQTGLTAPPYQATSGIDGFSVPSGHVIARARSVSNDISRLAWDRHRFSIDRGGIRCLSQNDLRWMPCTRNSGNTWSQPKLLSMSRMQQASIFCWTNPGSPPIARDMLFRRDSHHDQGGSWKTTGCSRHGPLLFGVNPCQNTNHHEPFKPV